jgi:YVTN family beta-propeller protein
MKCCTSMFPAILAFIVAAVLGNAETLGSTPQYAYITNSGSDIVSVIDTETEGVTKTIAVGRAPGAVAVAVTPDGTKVYVANRGADYVSVISVVTNTVIATIPVYKAYGPAGMAATADGSKVYVALEQPLTDGSYVRDVVMVIDTKTDMGIAYIPLPNDLPRGVTDNFARGVAVTQDGARVYVADFLASRVSVIDTATYKVTTLQICCASFPFGVAVTPKGSTVYVSSLTVDSLYAVDTATNTFTAKIAVGKSPRGVAVTPDGSKVYVANSEAGTVSVFAPATGTVTTFAVGNTPWGVSVTPDGSRLYVANRGSDTVWVIATATNTMIGKITVGGMPEAFGEFIAPAVPGLTVQSKPPAGSLCSGPFDSTISGDLTVSDGQDCRIINGGQVTGNVTVSGGNFVLSGAAVGGSVTVDGGTVTIGPAATVDGDVLISNLAMGDTRNSVCGTMVRGSLQADGNAAAVQIGSTAPLVCAGNKIGGDFEVDGNSAAALVFDNRVTGALQADNNTGLLDVVGNTVGTTLQCQNNTMLVMGGMNTAGQKQGQCH